MSTRTGHASGPALRRAVGLAVAAGLAAVLYLGWQGFRIGALDWPGAWAVLGDGWLWDLRWPLLPAYAVAALWGGERAAAMLCRGR